MKVAHITSPVALALLGVLVYPPGDTPSFVRGLGSAFCAHVAVQSLVVIWRDWRKA